MLPTIRMTGTIAAAIFASTLVLASAGHPDLNQSADGKVARAELRNPDGRTIGRAELRETPAGVLLHLTLTGAPAGVHALHLHETGRCEAPDFESAGGHANPGGAEHGLMNPKGPHAGDLPNLHVPASGTLELELLAARAELGDGEMTLLDADGAAVVMHAHPDDYRTDPAGAAGDRIACGVVEN